MPLAHRCTLPEASQPRMFPSVRYVYVREPRFFHASQSQSRSETLSLRSVTSVHGPRACLRVARRGTARTAGVNVYRHMSILTWA